MRSLSQDLRIQSSPLTQWFRLRLPNYTLASKDFREQIRATINPKFERDWLYQILGYAFLDFEDSHHIHSVGLYFARQGILVQWPLVTLLPNLAGAPVALDTLREEFRAIVAVTP